jgi:hypothetical protein
LITASIGPSSGQGCRVIGHSVSSSGVVSIRPVSTSTLPSTSQAFTGRTSPNASTLAR